LGKDKLLCDNCELEIEVNSEFCPRCGSIFIEEVKCEKHPENEAEGVCVICAGPGCYECGNTSNNIFLCNEHKHYDIFEGMAKVFGTSDEINIQFVKKCLEENDLHPFIYSKKSSQMQLGGIDYSLINISADSDNKVLNEIKLLVPCGEVIEAEKVINEIKN
jgi:hypothetical protein